MKIQRICLEETDSTNRYIKEIDMPEVDFLVVTAQWQTAGKGQGQNTWESERGKNLLFSLLVHPTFLAIERQFLLSMAGALALKDTLERYVGEVNIKWPNDIYWHDKKISGTLIETRVAGQKLKEVVLGIGINVNQEVFRSDAPNPVSIHNIVGHEVSTDEILNLFLQKLEHYYGQLQRGEEANILRAYHQALYRREGFHLYQDQRGLFEAKIIEVMPNGLLVLQNKEGEMRSYALKEVAYVLKK